MSNIPACPITLFFENPVAICASAVISSKGLDTTITTEFGACLAIFSETCRTIFAFVSIKSILLIPGFLGSPAVITTIEESLMAS